MTTVALAAIALGSPFPFAQGVYSMSSMPFVVVHASTVKGPALFKVSASGSVLVRAEMLANERIIGVDEDQRLIASLCGDSTSYSIRTLEPTPRVHKPVYQFGTFSISDNQVTERLSGREHSYRGQVGAASLQDKHLYVIRPSLQGTHLERLGGGKINQLAKLPALAWLSGLVVQVERSLALCIRANGDKEALTWIDMKTGALTLALEVKTGAFPGDLSYDRYSALAMFDGGRTLAWCTRDGLNLVSVDWASKKLGVLRVVNLR